MDSVLATAIRSQLRAPSCCGRGRPHSGGVCQIVRLGVSLIFVVAGSLGKSVCLESTCGRTQITKVFMGTKTFLLGILTLTLTAAAADETNSNEALLSGFMPIAAPQPTQLVLRRGDRLAICGD